MGIALMVMVTVIVVCNIIVVAVSKGRCYDDTDAIPHNTYGLLLGTGRSSKPSPYYDARLQAATDLYHAGKVDYIVVSGENLHADYNEVDSMVAALETAGVPVAFVDYRGTDTYASLHTFGEVFGYTVPPTIISQHYHNQRAVFYGALLFREPPIAYNAADTDIWYWNLRRVLREVLARTKAVLTTPYLYMEFVTNSTFQNHIELTLNTYVYMPILCNPWILCNFAGW